MSQQREYNSMSELPSHGNASRAKVANAQMGPREGFHQGSMVRGGAGMMQGGYPPGMAGGRMMEMGCAFPAPPPARVYCMPSPFTNQTGEKYQRIINAYGHSRPALSNYM